MTNESELERIANVVKDTQHGKEKNELVFNPETGEFEQRPVGTRGDGEIVTEMTKEGFAA